MWCIRSRRINIGYRSYLCPLQRDLKGIKAKRVRGLKEGRHQLQDPSWYRTPKRVKSPNHRCLKNGKVCVCLGSWCFSSPSGAVVVLSVDLKRAVVTQWQQTWLLTDKAEWTPRRGITKSWTSANTISVFVRQIHKYWVICWILQSRVKLFRIWYISGGFWD